MRFLTDGKRHLICVPYSISGLHVMAAVLKIDRCFYHFKNKNTGRIRPHYDIPAKRKNEIEALCEHVSAKEITTIINKYTDSIYNKKQLFKK
jgi:hypothetical protein